MKRQVFTAMSYAAVVGAVAGVVWGLALDVGIANGLIVGVLVGLVVGALLGVISGSAAKGGVQDGEAMFVTGSLLGLLGIASIGLGVLVWLIRVIFF